MGRIAANIAKLPGVAPIKTSATRGGESGPRLFPLTSSTLVLAINGSAILHDFNSTANGTCGRSAADRRQYRQAAGAIEAQQVDRKMWAGAIMEQKTRRKIAHAEDHR